MGDQILTKHSNIPREILDLLGEIGGQTQLPVYLVGGFVRDILLGRENLDLDIVVEEDAIGLAQKLGEMWGQEVQMHQHFGTATVIQPAGVKIDFTSARSETYAHPGALPLVKPGTIEDDLRRRDFSINALAIRLNADHFGELLDRNNGVQDLQTGRVRTLHGQSFIDDPTRIFRAVRYEQRYGFRIAEDDQARIYEAIHQGLLDLISGERIRNEINRILAEEAVPRMIQRLLEFDLFRAIQPEWKVALDFGVCWNAAQKAADWALTQLSDEEIDAELFFWMSLFAAAICGEPQSRHGSTPTYAIQAVVDRLVLPHQLRKLFRIRSATQKDFAEGRISADLWETFEDNGISLSENAAIRVEINKWLITDKHNKQTYAIRKEKQWLYIHEIRTELTANHRLHKTLNVLSADSKASEVYNLLKSYPLEALVFALVQPEQPEWQAEKIEDYLVNLREIQALINGDDLIQLGLKPGRAFTDLLWKAFAAQLDGEISTKQEAYEFLGFK